MDNFLNLLSDIMNAFGSAVVVPIVLFVICLLMKVKPKKAFQSALNCGIGLIGFNLLIGAYTPILAPVIERMVETTGINMNIIDTGWQPTAGIIYSAKISLVFLALGLVMQTFLFAIRFTNIFQPSDLWNNYSYMIWGAMLQLVTGNTWLAILLMVLTNLYCLMLSEITEKRWSKYYGIPGATLAIAHDSAPVPLTLAMNWLLDKLGANKIKLNPQTIEKRLGLFGEATTLGLLLGLILGILGNLTRLNTLEGWGEAVQLAVATAAIMAIFPKIAAIFSSAFSSITSASKKNAKKSTKGGQREWYIAINDAAGYGEPATLLSGMILIPIILILAVVLPGNQALPMIDLIGIPYLIQAIVAMTNGNIFKTVIIGAVYLCGGLYMVTAVAPIFNDLAVSVGYEIPSGAMMIFSIILLANWVNGLLFLIFLNGSPLLIGLSIIVYVGCYLFVRTKRDSIHEYLEKQALGDEYVPEPAAGEVSTE